MPTQIRQRILYISHSNDEVDGNVKELTCVERLQKHCFFLFQKHCVLQRHIATKAFIVFHALCQFFSKSRPLKSSDIDVMHELQGYLAHKKLPPP